METSGEEYGRDFQGGGGDKAEMSAMRSRREKEEGGRSCFDFRLRRMNICSTRPSGPCAATLPINTALYACWLSGPPTTDNRKETPEKLLCLAPSPPLFASFLPLSLYSSPTHSPPSLLLSWRRRNVIAVDRGALPSQ